MYRIYHFNKILIIISLLNYLRMEKQMNSNYLTLFKAPKIDLHLHLQGAANMHVFSHLVNINKHTVINQILNDDFLYERYSWAASGVEWRISVLGKSLPPRCPV